MTATELLTDAIDTALTLGWAFAAWIVVLAFVGAIVLLAAIAAVVWVVQAVRNVFSGRQAAEQAPGVPDMGQAPESASQGRTGDPGYEEAA